MSNLVSNWFGEEFKQLDPKIQSLHTSGGELVGDIDLQYGTGVSGIVGRRLAKKLGLPREEGKHKLKVTIAHDDHRMQWVRTFNTTRMVSYFYPVGNYPDGYWREVSGNIELRLSVSTDGGVWRWVQRKTLLRNIPIPLVLMPKVYAYKKVVDNQYEFSVRIYTNLLGTFLSYGGVLGLSKAD